MTLSLVSSLEHPARVTVAEEFPFRFSNIAHQRTKTFLFPFNGFLGIRSLEDPPSHRYDNNISH
jgi:hypothetical protein